MQPRPTTLIGEVRRTRAPSVLAELGYHDNPEDAQWIEDNLDRIAQALVRGVCEYFGVPFVEPSPVQKGIVTVSWGSLNIRDTARRRPGTAPAPAAGAPGSTDLWEAARRPWRRPPLPGQT